MISPIPDTWLTPAHPHTFTPSHLRTSPTLVYFLQWFWNALHSLTQEELALFVQFVTGTSKVPLGGFKDLMGMRGPQRFQIHIMEAKGPDSLPMSHTCFNQLDLPKYTSEEMLRERLVLAIKECSEGFGFG